MQKLHVGSGTSRGALTVFPLWGEETGAGGYEVDASSASVVEQPGPAVSTLTAANPAARPLLMLEGQVLEGGWQNRVVGRSVLVPAGAAMTIDVLCVEAGRWGGGNQHRSAGRRASLRVRGAVHGESDQQREVWRRVAEYDSSYGENETASFTVHADRAQGGVDRLVAGIRPLAGQVGLVVGIAGQPVLAEIFDSAGVLAREFDSLLRSAALDALGQPEISTPSRRARRFVDRLSRLDRRAVAPAGVGATLTGSDAYVSMSALTWRRRDVHLVATNPRHPLLVGSH